MMILMKVYPLMNGIARNVGFSYRREIDASIVVIPKIINNQYE